MKNVQVIDRADNAIFSIFQVTEDEFAVMFPAPDQDIELVEDLIERMGEANASSVLSCMWQRPILKRDVHGIHGTLYYGADDARWRQRIPANKREIDTDDAALNEAQRRLFREKRRES